MKTIEDIEKELAELKRQESLCVDSCSWTRAFRINRQVKTLEWVLNGAKEIEES